MQSVWKHSSHWGKPFSGDVVDKNLGPEMRSPDCRVGYRLSFPALVNPWDSYGLEVPGIFTAPQKMEVGTCENILLFF